MTLDINKKLKTAIIMFDLLKSFCIRKRNALYVSQPRPNREMVSLKIPDPQTKTLGINKIVIATGRRSLGYKEANVLNNAQIPVNEITAKITDAGK